MGESKPGQKASHLFSTAFPQLVGQKRAGQLEHNLDFIFVYMGYDSGNTLVKTLHPIPTLICSILSKIHILQSYELPEMPITLSP